MDLILQTMLALRERGFLHRKETTKASFRALVVQKLGHSMSQSDGFLAKSTQEID